MAKAFTRVNFKVKRKATMQIGKCVLVHDKRDCHHNTWLRRLGLSNCHSITMKARPKRDDCFRFPRREIGWLRGICQRVSVFHPSDLYRYLSTRKDPAFGCSGSRSMIGMVLLFEESGEQPECGVVTRRPRISFPSSPTFDPYLISYPLSLA